MRSSWVRISGFSRSISRGETSESDLTVTESTIANLAVRLDGRWWTPPLSSGLLPGIERAVALADGRIAERALSLEDVRRAEGLALLNSVRGWRPATLV